MKFKKPKILSYQQTIRFHGHVGPFLALGYRLGEYLNAKLRPKGIMDFKITVKTRTEKPFTCIIDGLQCSTFATMGKRNIVVKKGNAKDIRVMIEKGSRRYTYRITKKALDICLGAEDLKKASQRILKSPDRTIWRAIQ
jgi:formylmethanofuran dehydrogenase subunit E